MRETEKWKSCNISPFFIDYYRPSDGLKGGNNGESKKQLSKFQQTGSAASMALVTLLAFLPTLLLSVPAGVLADRYDRRKLMMVGDGCSALGILYISICMTQDGARFWQIRLGVFISATFSALLEPSYRATVTDLLTKEEYSKASGIPLQAVRDT